MNQNKHVSYDDLVLADDQSLTWQDRPFTGIAFEDYPDGSRHSEASYIDGIQQGLAQDWYPSGQIKQEMNYWNGATHGIARQWDESGRLLSERMYELGILVGDKEWNEQGTMTKDWRIGPDHNLYHLLELGRKKYGESAPPVG